MEYKIRIKRDDLGLGPKSVKSLLDKVGEINRCARAPSSDDKLEVFLEFSKEDTNELSTAIIWRTLMANSNLKIHKTITYQDGTQVYFDERHFFDSLTGQKSSIFSPTIPINYETFKPVRPTKNTDPNDQINKIFNDVTKNVIRKDDEFQGELRTHMIECVQNAYDHSESNEFQPAGITCSLKKNELIEFCVVDMGQGMKKSFISNPALEKKYIQYNDSTVIYEATKKGTSCNPSYAKHPGYSYNNGGIGLYYLNEFIRFHTDSQIVILSGKGYYHLEYMQAVPKLLSLNSGWPGTLVYFRTRLRQRRSEKYAALSDAYISDFDNRVLAQGNL